MYRGPCALFTTPPTPAFSARASWIQPPVGLRSGNPSNEKKTEVAETSPAAVTQASAWCMHGPLHGAAAERGPGPERFVRGRGRGSAPGRPGAGRRGERPSAPTSGPRSLRTQASASSPSTSWTPPQTPSLAASRRVQRPLSLFGSYNYVSEGPLQIYILLSSGIYAEPARKAPLSKAH